ncbi:hypothetical protein TNCV_4217741 [Trichonephila clavipes]|nr:hypothetical protein TNCV_4217741 [Trichonephila clavipes]
MLRQLQTKSPVLKSTKSIAECSNECGSIIRKETFIEFLTLQFGTFYAVLQINGGSKVILSVLEHLHIPTGCFILKGFSKVEDKDLSTRETFIVHCQVIYSQFGLAIHENDHQSRRRFVEWAPNEIAVVPDFHKRNLFSDEAHFWWNGYVNKRNCRIWSEANPQVYVETPLHPEKLTGALYGVVESLVRTSSKTMKATTLQSMVYADKPQTLDHLDDNIRRIIADLRPQMLEKVIENWTSRLDYIRASRGSHIPEIIFKMKEYENALPRNVQNGTDHSRFRSSQKSISLHFPEEGATRVPLDLQSNALPLSCAPTSSNHCFAFRRNGYESVCFV